MSEYEWVEDDFINGAGFSHHIHGHTVLPSGQVVLKYNYFPGPFHAKAYGGDSPLAQIKETFRVWCNHIDVDPPALVDGAVSVYGFPSEDHPDPEACVWFMEFDCEATAIKYAASLPAEWWYGF